MNIIFLLILLGINLSMALLGRIIANPHKNIILETTLPKDKLNEPQVLNVRQEYKKRLLLIAAAFSIFDLLILLTTYDSITLLFFMLSLFMMLGVNYYTEILYIRKMTHVKITNGWILPTKPLLVDTKLIQNKNRKLLSYYWYLPGILISLGGTIYSFTNYQQALGTAIFGVISLLMAGLFIFLHYLVSRLPVKPLTNDEIINQQVNDAMRHYWSLLLVSSAFIFSPLSFIPILSITLSYQSGMILTIAYFILLTIYVGFIFYLLFKLRRTQDQLIMQAKDYRYGDEDQYWRYGIYINPEDPRIFVPDRLGMNISTNLGRPAGKISMIVLLIVAVAAVALSSIPLMISDFSSNPFRMTVTTDDISLSAPFSKTREIPLDIITSVQLIDKLPANRIRMFGSATDHYLTGEFRIGDESAYLLVYNNEVPILEIKTENYTYYYTNKDAEKTKKEYEELIKKVNK
ncbi:hypothetical protein IW492_06400 [Enterococcus sp. BWB1-3]|uniref:PH domain-containing protein n=1 Tax=Enterococcus sp. BWB1-3 TaxID=2787713 RepID=UPI001920DC51|nr:PH domain-containing protein [Enterococcus sp. BWB1-3]MBL1228863.1 hypothetical protein [Enterococcus sp. BWB1-3]